MSGGVICIGYHMSGEVISVLSLEGRYYNCHERARDNYDIVTRVVIKDIRDKKRYQGDISFLCPPIINLIMAQVCDKSVLSLEGRYSSRE